MTRPAPAEVAPDRVERLRKDEPRVVFAHLSDLHVEGRGTERAAVARDALGHSALDEADLVVVTGDLTDSGSPAEARALETALDAAAARRPVLAVPGNHDLPRPLPGVALGPAGDAVVLRSLAARSRRSGFVRVPDAVGSGFPAVLAVAEGRCLVYGLDSTWGVGERSLARGRLGADQLAALDCHLAALDPGQRRVLALHHHPVALPAGRRLWDLLKEGDWAHGLEDRDALRDLLRRHRVDLVLHGHRHHFLRRRLGTTRIVSGSSTTKGCGLTGQRFFAMVSLGLVTGAVEVRRVQVAAPVRWPGLAEVFETAELVEDWVKAAERAYESEDTFVAVAHALEERMARFRDRDEVSRVLDEEFARLLWTGREEES